MGSNNKKKAKLEKPWLDGFLWKKFHLYPVGVKIKKYIHRYHTGTLT